MEIVQEFSSQYMLYIPVALVIVGAILVFTFGFKSADQPPFDKLSIEDRKSAGKKKKIKEKKSAANGHVSTGEVKADRSPKKSPAKENVEAKPEKKEKKVDSKLNEKTRKSDDHRLKNNFEEGKNKKNSKKALSEKPADFDEGNWETVPSKADKKKKGDQSPVKKDKKSKKGDKLDKVDIENFAKEIINKEDKQSEVEDIVEESSKVEEKLEIEEPVPVIEEKKEKEKKKKEKKPKKENEKVDNLTDKKQDAQPVSQSIKHENINTKPEKESPPEEKIDAQEPKKEEKAVFDELGDVWTEAKAPKKTTKKKARRDN